MSHLRYHIKHKKVVLSDRSRCRTGLVLPLLVNSSLLSRYNYNKTKEKEVKRLHAEVYILLENKKLAFYNEIKSSFGLEPYISLPNHKKTRCTTWLRTSSHKLNIETGRYGWKNSSIFYRACHFCCTSDRITIDLLNELPFSDIIKEDEVHLLKECPVYKEIRQRTSTDLHNMLTNSQFSKLFNENYIVETRNFVYNLFRERFPKSNL